MLRRVKGAVWGVARRIVRVLEDPERLLEHHLRDLQQHLPKMNESVSLARANLALLDRENAKHHQEIADLTAKVKAAIRNGQDDLASQYALRLQMERGALSRNEAFLKIAQASFDKAEGVCRAFLEQKQRKTDPLLHALKEPQRGLWQNRLIQTLDACEAAGADSVEEETVRPAEAMTRPTESDERVLVNQFKKDMGLSGKRK